MTVHLLVLAAAEVDEGLLDACGEAPSWPCETMWNLTHNQAIAQAGDWLITRPFAALVVLAIAWIISRSLRKTVTALINRLTKSSRVASSALQVIGVGTGTASIDDAREQSRASTLAAVSRASVSALVWSIAALIVLGIFEVNLGPLLAGAGIAGIAIGLGAQSLVRDCIAGFFILLEDQCGVGDEIDLGTAAGTVESLTLRAVQVRGADGTLWSIANGTITKLGNRTRTWSQGNIDLRVSPSADLDAALHLIDEAVRTAAAEPDVAADLLEAPQVLGVERVEEAGIVLRVSVRTTPGRQWAVMRVLRLAAVRALTAGGVLPPVNDSPDRGEEGKG